MNEKKLSFKAYRAIDILIFTILTLLFETVALWATREFNGIFYISIFYGMSLIVMKRWNIHATITIVASGFLYALILSGLPSKENINNYLVYIIGDLFILIDMVWFIKGKEKLNKSGFLIGYIISGFLLVEFGRSFMFMLFGNNFISIFLGMIGPDSMSLLITFLIILIAKKQNGLFEDQKKYLIRLNKEELEVK